MKGFKTRFLRLTSITVLGFFFSATVSSKEKLFLKKDWEVQSSVNINQKGETISSVNYKPSGWYKTSVPATVLAVLVENKVYPDPYYGENLKSIPGYVSGKWLAMPKDSPFYPPWWYRTVFRVPDNYRGKNLILHFDGINYKANIWLNGKRIADSDTVIGMFRRFEFNVNDYIRFGEENCLAVEVIAPGKLPQRRYITKQLEATTGWDDHNPYPPDMNLGIWQDVYLTATDAVRLKNPYVVTDLDLPSLDVAHLSVSVDVINLTDKEVNTEIMGMIEDIKFSQKFTLSPKEKRLVKFSPQEYKELNIAKPRLWWPNPVGPQELYELKLYAKVNNKISDDESVKFGIREVNTYLNDEGWRQYEVNGKKILIRGGAWMTSDMMLRLSRKRYEALIRYAREANLNMLRSEGFSIRETDEFYDLCDKYGVMVTQQIFGRNIPDEKLAISCIEDMMLRIRNHPSLVHFLGHDETFPTPTLDRAYQDLIEKYDLRRTYQPHSGAFNVKDRLKTGGTRTGTLELWTYAGPAHYYTHKEDGAWGFAQSGGIGGVVASLESIKRMIPENELWPLWTPSWSFHTVIQGGEYFNDLLKALNIRYGKPSGIEDFVITAQAMNYESARGMFEAYARNKYSATGITTWKYDTAWPAGMTWQYIDWYLLPTGAYYGAKKACEALHIQYSYDDNSIYVVNSLYRDFKGLIAEAKVYDFELNEKFSKSESVSVEADGKTKAFIVEFPKDLTRSYFLSLKLRDEKGKVISDNFYWLSTRPEAPPKKYYGTIALKKGSYFDHSDLRKLPKINLDLTCKLENKGDENVIGVKVKNSSSSLAFFIQLAVTKGSNGFEVAPSYWQDNDFSLLPKEEKTLEVRFAKEDLEGKEPVISLGGWNIEKEECFLR